MASSRKSKGRDKIVIPKIVNVMNIHKTTGKPTLLHFTPEQWKQLIEGLKPADKFAEGHLTLEAFPMPGAQGIMLATIGGCYPPCSPLYDCVGDTPENFTCFLSDCICPDPGGDTSSNSSCRLAFHFGSGDTSLVSLICVDKNTGKRCSDYEPGVVAHSNGGTTIGCVHK